jgi:hypothetical protein
VCCVSQSNEQADRHSRVRAKCVGGSMPLLGRICFFCYRHLLIKKSINVSWKKSGLSRLAACLALGITTK